MGKRRWHEVRISCGRVMGNDDPPEFMSITITAVEPSGIRIGEVRLSMEDFGRMVTSQQVHCQFAGSTTLLGSTMEHKQEWVRLPKGFRHRPDGDELAIVCAPLEKYGWLASTHWSQRRQERGRDGHEEMLVDFTRYIGEDGQPITLR